ncbi:glycosyltransferase [Elizabethkingia bruuniana]|uniref:Glycosyltransferase n=1 Tax=Elizabethkingia bruuniana TaxID=1756149 RepID=A0A7T7ZW62_9FLAO|nr:glycosyltransferase [Elizabethkingia bruuniana]KGO11820.1 hypothetical protein KS04_01330 [Elizabethkingia miricola]AQX83615.1 hypothetical protein AYC65_00630 [Elizabethkingia bruuniana]KUY22270.1 hypothetical protein ATB97_13565 [Elizabethkingia bruuniana]OPB62481.1 hypothetical protein BAY12_11305 [Elizabethkingia bruuniana]QDZ63617.1 glycosyltransferase [Elizabethkingia bruuniana]
MNELPLVSIIVISYNQEAYIRENLDSIKSQSYANIELIVADDASEDNSRKIFEQWLTENNYVANRNFHSKNTGVVTILNECIEMATGEYIKIIAADDFLHENAIEKCISELENLGDDYGMIYTDAYTINEKSKIQADIMDCTALYNADSEKFYDLLVLRNRILALSVVMRTSVLVETGVYDDKFIVEDYCRWLKIAQLYKIAYIPEKLAFYRWHNSNVTILKADRIKKDDISLKIMFDRNGIARNVIRNYLIKERIQKNKIDTEILKSYNKYSYRNKVLAASLIQTGFIYIPLSFVYRKLNKLMK